jgi:phosphoglycolate phosphatase-like HAD superfamily hydrolase
MKIPMGIVTGNIKKAGEAILKGSDLFDFFDPRFNSYGDEAAYRSEIVYNAIESAKKINTINKDAKIFVFGDTPADVEAARKNNCTSIAVIKNSNDKDSSPEGKSYFQRKELLKKSEPDYLLDDYTDIKKILSILHLG